MTITARSNWWPNAKCAKAFRCQQDFPPYQRLLEDTFDWAAPEACERWLDLGSGGGAITRAIWEPNASHGVRRPHIKFSWFTTSSTPGRLID